MNLTEKMLLNNAVDSQNERNKLLRENIELKKRELQNRDRVDISKNEYLNLLNENKTLKSDNERYRELINNFLSQVPNKYREKLFNSNLKPEVITRENPAILTTDIIIVFKVNEYEK